MVSEIEMRNPMDLVNILERLNRKERFFLFKLVIDKTSFVLSDDLLKRLQTVTSLTIPRTAFFATDYHLDWLYAALTLYKEQDMHGVFSITNVAVNNNQEDIDLIIAYKEEGYYQILLVEAKGTGSWTNKQLESKIRKLQAIFGAKLEQCPPDVQVRFVLASPKKPKRVKVSNWPSWVLSANGGVSWIPLDIPPDRLQFTRCDQNRIPSNLGTYWALVTSEES